DDLVQTILRVADNPEEARNAAHKSRQKVEREYSFERMVSQYEEIYNSAVG
ncbi:MAG: glycosyltransferase family 1 protein, partial [Deltaproteobacteria bacterium]